MSNSGFASVVYGYHHGLDMLAPLGIDGNGRATDMFNSAVKRELYDCVTA